MNFHDRLRAVQQKQNSLLCLGLDTDPLKVPPFLAHDEDPVGEFNRRIIEATSDLVCAYKINLAFYEAIGAHGWKTVHQTLAYIPPDVITIGDAKRGDIGNSAELYARALFDDFKFSACTVNPYMGGDSVEPFMKDSRHGVFVLAVTSNPGAKDFQYLNVRGKPLYEHVISKVKRWNANRNCGLVVGATRPKELQRIRALAPGLPLLIPGIGAQGGDLKRAVQFGSDHNGEMAVINVGRSVLYASQGRDFDIAARTAAVTLRNEINRFRLAHNSAHSRNPQ